MKITEKCDIYSYGVVVLELVTGKTPVQPLEEGGDLVTLVRNYIKKNSISSDIFDPRLNLDDKSLVAHMTMVMKIALLCTSIAPYERPSMRAVVSMLIESNEREGHYNLFPSRDASYKDDI